MPLTLDIPEKFFTYQTPNELIRLLKLNTAIDLYRRGKLSAGAAAKFVGGIECYEFLYECRQRGVEPQTYENIEGLQAAIEMLAKGLESSISSSLLKENFVQ